MIFGNRKTRVWNREPNEFARRLDISDIEGLFGKHITIEHGTQALFLQGGRFAGELPPGTYKDIGGVIKALKIDVAEKATVILVDVGDVSLDLHIEDLLTNESVHVGMSGNVTIQAEAQELNKLFVNLMKGRELLEIRDLEKLLEGEMKSILQAKIKNHSVDEFYGNLELKKEIEQDFEHLMRTTFEESGLKLKRLTGIDYVFSDEIVHLRYLRGKVVIEDEVIRLEKEIRELEKKVEISEIESKAEIEKIKREKEHELEMLELKRKYEIRAKSREVSVGTTLPPLLNDAKSSKTRVERRLEALSDRIERRRRGENLP
ncbi:MAG: SPFH domain-containing protein [Candidatus Methanospirareceae archaeon]